MSDSPLVIRGIAWDHPRGVGGARSAAEAYAVVRPDVRVEWDVRPLWKFAYMPLEEMFSRYDLVLFDYPTIGTLVDGQPPMAPMDELLGRDRLEALSRDSVGPSFESYAWRGQQWAAPIDAAAQVAVYRPDLLPPDLEVPSTWDEVERVAATLAALGVGLGLPMNYSDASSNLCTLGSQIAGEGFFDLEWGFDAVALEEALGRLERLVKLADPATFPLPPVAALADMANGSTIGYMPLQFGYVNYARPGFARHLLTFVDAPSPCGSRQGSSLGGVGVGISRTSSNQSEAARFVEYVTSAECQRGAYFVGGGQPGSRAAWLDEHLDEQANGFFSRTLATLEGAVIRPRIGDCAWFFDQQVEVGNLLSEAAVKGEPIALLADEIIRIDRRHARASEQHRSSARA